MTDEFAADARRRSSGMERQAITVEGIVQGVGFRPFVYALATRLKLCGFVKNQSGRVLIEAEGSRPALDCCVRELRESAPPLARIDALSCESRALRGEDRFRIEPSEDDHGSPIFISPDVATLRRLPGGVVRSVGPALSLSVSQLHKLRSAPDDYSRRALRSDAVESRLQNARPAPRCGAAPESACG
jgi:acylphosphatase